MLQQTARLIESQWKQIGSQEFSIDQFIINFTRLIESLERSFSRQQIVEALAPFWRQLSSSPFVHRAQQWPRGYAGDYETIDYILRGKNGASAEGAGYELEEFLLNSPICRQHRNKIGRQSALIKEAIISNNRARILSIGCGTSEDLVQNLEHLIHSSANVTLMDIDDAALKHSASRLAPIKERLALIRGNIYRSAARIPGQFDLVIIGGVFDYLDDRMVIAVLSALQPRIAEGGVLFFTNIRSDNPYRVCMEYMANWQLIHRSDEDILRIIRASGLQGFQCLLTTDDTGLTHLVSLHA